MSLKLKLLICSTDAMQTKKGKMAHCNTKEFLKLVSYGQGHFSSQGAAFEHRY